MSPSLLHLAPEEEPPRKTDAVIQHILPVGIHVTNIRPFDGHHLHAIYLVTLSNDTRLVVKYAPHPTTPLLRREQKLLMTEAHALSLLQESNIATIPSLLFYDPHGACLGSPVLIRPYTPGVSLREVKHDLSTQERNNIDHALGHLGRQIAHHTSDSFGTLEEVAAGKGKKTWRDAFLSLFETVLRDAEDVFVNLPYSEIRQQVCRLAHALDEVTIPRLVVADLGHESHTLVDSESRRLAGVVDLGRVLWGDPRMAPAFEAPSSALLEGFGCHSRRSEAEMARQLLYACHRSVQQITVQYYRARNMATENEGRRRLTRILGEMARVCLC